MVPLLGDLPPVVAEKINFGLCWEWTAHLNNGYGRLTYEGEDWIAHRLVYAMLVGDPGPGLDHFCRNHGCVNPDHLDPVTQRVNTLRGHGPTALNARRTHCRQGHEFTPENTTLTRGRRQCRTCHRAKCRAQYEGRAA